MKWESGVESHRKGLRLRFVTSSFLLLASVVISLRSALVLMVPSGRAGGRVFSVNIFVMQGGRRGGVIGNKRQRCEVMEC